MLIHLRRINPLEFKSPYRSSQTVLNSLTKPISTPQNPTETLTKPQLKALVLTQYSRGTFSNLVSNVLGLPNVLLTACQNLTSSQSNNGLNSLDSQSLLNSVARRFDIKEMGCQLCENRFNIETSYVTMMPSRMKGESLVLPNLKLKVLIEAIRMVLEIVHDERFVTFSYGGLVGMGRHTAIRYLKNSVENPGWWFSVTFDRERFDDRHVNKLCLFIEERIKDGSLIGSIKRLFECKVVGIELGGCYLGRGVSSRKWVVFDFD